MRFALTALLLLLSACSDKVIPLTPLSGDAVVVAFGDSLTYGTGAASHQSYPAVLSNLIKREVINAGVPGELSADGMKRIERVLDTHKPELLLLCHGGNDMLRKKSLTSAQSNIKEIIRLAQTRGAQVMLIGVPEPKIFGLKSAEFYYALSVDMQVPIEADILPHVLSTNAFKSDAIHPNAEGYKKIAHAVAQLLQKSGAIFEIVQ